MLLGFPYTDVVNLSFTPCIRISKKTILCYVILGVIVYFEFCPGYEFSFLFYAEYMHVNAAFGVCCITLTMFCLKQFPMDKLQDVVVKQIVQRDIVNFN